MTMKEKFTWSFTYRRQSKNTIKKLSKYGQGYGGSTLSKWTEEKNLLQPSVSFKVWQRICMKLASWSRRKSKSRQRVSYKPFALTALTAHCKSLLGNQGYVHNQNLKNIGQFGPKLPSTQQMVLLMFGQMQNRNWWGYSALHPQKVS